MSIRNAITIICQILVCFHLVKPEIWVEIRWINHSYKMKIYWSLLLQNKTNYQSITVIVMIQKPTTQITQPTLSGRRERRSKGIITMVMFGIHILKNYVHCNQNVVIIHAFGDANVIAVIFGRLHLIWNVIWLLLCLVDYISSQMWCDWIWVWFMHPTCKISFIFFNP